MSTREPRPATASPHDVSSTPLPEQALRRLVTSVRTQDWVHALELARDVCGSRDDVLLALLSSDEHELRELGVSLALEQLSERDEVVDTLIEALNRSRHPGFAQAAILVLRAVETTPSRAAAIDALLTTLSEDDHQDVRYQALAARELREHEGEAYITRLLTALSTRDEDMRIIAAQGLARLRPEAARVPLRAAYAEARSGEERFQVLLARASLRDPGLVPEFERAMRSGAQRFAAIRALGAYGDPSAAEGLLRCARAWLGDTQEKVAAAQSLAQLGDARGLTRLEAFAASRRPEVRGQALEALVVLSAPGVEARLIDALRTTNDPAAAMAASLLVDFPGLRTQQALAEACEDPRPEVREQALEALHALRAKTAP